MRITSFRRALTTFIFGVSLILSLTPLSSASIEQKTGALAGGIRVTPPAPAFNDDERRAELSARRARVAKEIGPTSMLIMLSAEPRIYTNDVNYEYRQENNFYYLTHLKQKGATLVLMPGNTTTREILFLPRRNPMFETWNGFMYSPEDARRLSGITEIWEAGELQPFLQAMRNRQPYRPKAEGVLSSAANGATTPSAANATAEGRATAMSEYESLFAAISRDEAALYLLVPPREAESGEFGESREWRQEQRLAAQWRKEATGFKIRSAFPIFAQMRLRKSPSEIQRLQHAIDITTEAFGRAMATAGRARMEYEVEAEVEYTFKRRNADYWGYPSIVGCGPNATTLHYEESQGRVSPGDLLLMDVGAEYDHYTADITRTFPVNGKFSPAQADIYRIVLAAQEAGFRASRPGSSTQAVNDAATEVIKDGLLRLGLITERDGTIPGTGMPQFRLWFMHGTSHWLGMNVHDIGGPGTIKLEPGMVYTNEPGIYIRADALDYLPKTPEAARFIAAVRPAFEKYKTIGVRIEDDVLITPEGHRNLSAAIPRTIPDIEAFIARASKELRLSALDRHAPDAPFFNRKAQGFAFVGTPARYAAGKHAHAGD